MNKVSKPFEQALPLSADYPLSSGQRGLWFLHQMDPQSDRYTLPLTFLFSKEVSNDEIRSIIRIFTRRHALMRSTFHNINGEPKRRVHDEPYFSFSEHVVSAETTEALYKEVRELSAVPFDIEQGPLFRAAVIDGFGEKRILMLAFHHLICDGGSLPTLIREFEEIHKSLKEPVAPSEALDNQTNFNDFVTWQNAWLESEEGENTKKFWMEMLAGDLPVLSLPTSANSDTKSSVRGEFEKFQIPDGIRPIFKQVAEENKCSEFLVWFAAYFAFLYRYSAQEDIIVGTPSMGRPDADFDDLIGYFVNLVPIRSAILGTESLDEMVQRLKTQVYEALFNADFPLAELINALGSVSQRGDQPLFQTSFVWTRTDHLGVSEDSTLKLEIFPLVHQSGEQSIALELLVAENGIEGMFKFRTNLFNDRLISRLRDNFISFIEHLALNPNLAIDSIPVVTNRERDFLLNDLNDTYSEYPDETLIHGLFEEQARRNPDNTAVVSGEREMSYRELNSAANRLAHYLIKCGTTPDTIIGLAMDRSLEMVIGLMGILKAGGAYIPIDPNYPRERLAFMIRDSEIKHVIAGMSQAVILADQPVQTVILDDPEIGNMLNEFPTSDPVVGGLNSRNLAYLIYTSGSTGKPKGVMVEHRALVNRIDWMQKEYGLTEHDVVLQKTPFSFDVSVWEFTWAPTVGAKIVMAEPDGHMDPDYLAEIINKHGVTTLHFVPSMFRVMLEGERWAGCDSLRRVFCSGEALTPDLVESHFSLNNAELHNLYGPTEAAIDVTYWQALPSTNLKTVPIGKPIQNTQLLILDNLNRLVPFGVVGELHIGGAGLARGYLNRPELTREKFIDNPFGIGRLYKTGDMVRFLEDGNIEFTGRVDHQVKIRGFRIELGEIEHELSEFEEVKSVVVFTHQAETGGHQLIAYLATDGIVDEREFTAKLRAGLSKRLPEYMVPSAFILLEKLPLTSNGKIDRKSLPQPDTSFSQNDYIPPEGSLEIELTEIWGRLLPMDPGEISRTANFFELGGHSLLVTKLINEVSEVLGIEMAFRAIFGTPVLMHLAETLEAISIRKGFAATAGGLPEQGIEEVEW